MAAIDYSLKIDGIPGESAVHAGEIEVLSWSWGETQTASPVDATGGGSGKVQIQDFHFVMRTSKASPKLLSACATGEHIAKAILTCRKAGGHQQAFLKYTLSDLLVSSFQTSGGADDVPTDQISLNFRRLEKEYREQRPDGSLGDVVKADVTKE